MKKEDLRVRRTRKFLFNTLITLLQKPNTTFRGITVQEICDEAMIHRSTFYMHYHDKYDLFIQELKRMEENMTIEERKLRLKNPFTILDKEEMSSKSYHIFRKIQDDSYLTNLIQEFLKKQLRQDIITFSNKEVSSQIPLEIQAEFYAGTISMLNMWWIKNDKTQTAEEMNHYFRLLCNQQHFNFD